MVTLNTEDNLTLPVYLCVSVYASVCEQSIVHVCVWVE